MRSGMVALGLAVAMCCWLPNETWGAPSAELVLQTGHSSSVTSVAWSPDGKRLASASYDKTVIVWDALTGNKIRTLKGHSAGVTGVTWSPDGKRLASASYDKTMIVWDALTGERIHSLKGHSEPLESVTWSPDGKRLATASRDKTVIVWNALTGEQIHSLKGRSADVTSVSWSPDSKRLASASYDNTVIVWDAQSGEQIRSLKGHSNHVSSVAWSPDGKRLASAAYDKTVIVWDAQSGEQIRSLKGHSAGVTSVSWSPDSKRLASASWGDKAVMIVCDALTGEKIYTLKENAHAIGAVSWSPDGKRLATAAWDTGFRDVSGKLGLPPFGSEPLVVWDAQTGEKIRSLGRHSVVVGSISWSSDGKRLATTSGGRLAAVWDAQSGTNLFTFEECSLLTGMAWSPDGKRLATAHLRETVILWDALTGNKIRTLEGEGVLFVRHVSWSPDGKRLATTSLGRTLTVWDAHSGNKIYTLKEYVDWASSVTWSPDGKRLATTSRHEALIVWDALTGEKIHALKGDVDSASRATWSPDGKRLAAIASSGKTVIVWDAQRGKTIHTLEGNTKAITAVVWSPDGKRLASAARDHTLVVWDALTGEKIHTLTGHSDWVTSVSWSPDSKRLASASLDNTAQVWDAISGEKLFTLTGHSDWVTSVSWSPDGKRLASASWDGSSAIWNAESGQLLWQSLAFGSDWISITPQGYHHGSLAAEQFIRWRLPAEKGEWPRLVAASQFRDTFYRPDLFRYLFSEGTVARALARADDERGAKTRFTDVAREAPPFVIVKAPSHLGKLTEGEIRVEAIAKSTGDNPVSSLHLEVNGQPEGRIQRVQEPKPGQVPVEWNRVPLKPGPNTIRVSARAGGSIGYSDPIKVTWDTTATVRVRLHLLLIGISKYKHAPDAGGYRELGHAASDAARIRAPFTQQGKGLYDDIPEPIVLLDQDATRSAILKAVQKFSERMTKNDVGIIFFACHGDKFNDRLYLAAHDTRKDELLDTGISASQLRDTLAATKGRKYLFLDACHAGGVLQRGDASLHEDLIRELRKEATGMVIAAACQGHEEANEDGMGGYFTTALIEGLSGKAQSFRGGIYPRHLKVYVEDRLKEMTRPLPARNQQRPLFDGPEELMDVPLVVPLARAKP